MREYSVKNIYSIATPAALKIATMVLKVGRVSLLLFMVDIIEYSAFIYLMFVHGLIAAFEQTNSTNFINTMNLRTKNATVWGAINSFNLKFTLLFSIIGSGLITFNTNIHFQLEFGPLITIILVLFSANYFYGKLVVNLSILDFQKKVFFNTGLKLALEVLFIALCIIFMDLITKSVHLAFVYLTALLIVLIISFYLVSLQENNWEGFGSAKPVGPTPYWSQVRSQSYTVLALFSPVVAISYFGTDHMLAFYLAAAQIFQLGPVILLPILTALYPRLIANEKSFEKKFMDLAAVLTVGVALFYLLTGLFAENIFDFWSKNNLIVFSDLLYFIQVVSLIEVVHISLKYLFQAENKSAEVENIYRTSFISAVALFVFLIFVMPVLSATMLASVLFGILIISNLLIKIEMISVSRSAVIIFGLIMFSIAFYYA